MAATTEHISSCY